MSASGLEENDAEVHATRDYHHRGICALNFDVREKYSDVVMLSGPRCCSVGCKKAVHPSNEIGAPVHVSVSEIDTECRVQGS
jgi:hypothetical protein